MAPPTRQNVIQNRVAAVSIFVFCLAVGVGAQFMGADKAPTDPGNAAMAGILEPPLELNKKTDSKSLFIGIRKPTTQELFQALPEAKGKPTLIMFHSQYCFDCKKMRPVIERLMPTLPGIYYRHFDILKEGKTQPAVFNTFKPVTVPVLVFITPQGKITNVLYNYQNEKTLKAALDDLNKTAVKNPKNQTPTKKTPAS